MDFKQVEQKVTEIVNNIDPDNLVGFGAPEDEYSTQVHRIISIISKIDNKDSWEKEIYSIFFPKPDYQPEDAKEKIVKLCMALRSAFPEGIKVT